VALKPGLRGEVRLTVSDADTAVAFRSGSVPVLATPRIVALVEEATVAAVAGQIEAGATSVGVRVQLDHLQPSAVGAKVVAQAQLDVVEGRRLVFTVSVNDAHGLVAAGKVTRVIVDEERFLDKTR
jgi:predicted thioesterase